LCKSSFDYICSRLSSDACEQSLSFRLLLRTNRVAFVTLEDILTISFEDVDDDGGLISKFNPFLDSVKRRELQGYILRFMELCVYEDKLIRLKYLHTAYSNASVRSEQEKQAALQQIIQELLVKREWKIEQHPQWLAFEVKFFEKLYFYYFTEKRN
jgi:hypothetical protein